MLKEIIAAFRKADVVADMVKRIGTMLDDANWMFDKVADVMARQQNPDELVDELYAKDRQINQSEQALREKLATHLSLGNEGDLPACLVLMSIVKDVERVGDYCKNIFEVARFSSLSFSHKEFAEPLAEISRSVAGLFVPTRDAFVKTDRDIARRVLTDAGALSKQCDLMVKQLLNLSPGFPADEAVAYALLARYYKRVEGHLSNVATSVVSPLPMLDFRKKS